MGAPFPPVSTTDLPAYYRELGDDRILRSIKNFDDDIHFEQFDHKVRNPNSRNFLIDFGDDEAWCAFDLEANSYTRLLRTNVCFGILKLT